MQTLQQLLKVVLPMMMMRLSLVVLMVLVRTVLL
jgi:hypothetical protein